MKNVFKENYYDSNAAELKESHNKGSLGPRVAVFDIYNIVDE